MIFIVAVLFVFSIAAFFIYGFFDDLTEDINADLGISDAAKEPVQNLHRDYPSVFDTGFMIILILMWIGAIVSAFQIDTYPVYFGLTVFALILLLTVPPLLGNAFEETAGDDSLSGYTGSFPKLFWVMTHLLEVSIVMGGSILVTLFAKSRQTF